MRMGAGAEARLDGVTGGSLGRIIPPWPLSPDWLRLGKLWKRSTWTVEGQV